MRLFIEPTETLLFRKGRSFEAGEGNFAESMFPPTPETIQGALRAAIAAQFTPDKTLVEAFKEPRLLNLIGDRFSYARFRITGLSLGRRLDPKNPEKKEKQPPQSEDDPSTIERLFPLPSNLLNYQNKVVQLFPVSTQEAGIDSNLPSELKDSEAAYLLPDRNEELPNTKPITSPCWLPEGELRQLLRNQKTPDKASLVKKSDIYIEEPRFGIGMDNGSKTTREGLLYTALMIRVTPGYGFVVDIRLSKDADTPSKQSQTITELEDDKETYKELKDLLDNHWLTLGGERRTAHVRVLKEMKEPPSLEQSREGNMLYFATPAYFSNGWLPAQWPNDAVLISAALDRYQSIGGWQLVPGHYGGSSKDMLRCVPAGSVYYFSKKNVRFPQPLIQDSYGWQIGYGINYAGEYK